MTTLGIILSGLEDLLTFPLNSLKAQPTTIAGTTNQLSHYYFIMRMSHFSYSHGVPRQVVLYTTATQLDIPLQMLSRTGGAITTPSTEKCDNHFMTWYSSASVIQNSKRHGYWLNICFIYIEALSHFNNVILFQWASLADVPMVKLGSFVFPPELRLWLVPLTKPKAWA